MSRFAVGLILLLGVLSQALGQGYPTEYRLDSFDTINIRFMGEPDLNTQATVELDGTISLPMIGRIMISGMTTQEVADAIRRRYIDEKFFTEKLDVTVNISSFRPMRASVLGFVAQSGTYTFRPGDRILNLLSVAGGASSDTANLKRATLVRRGSDEKIPIDLHAMLERGELSQNYILEDGDVLQVPQQLKNFYIVHGVVFTPGRFIYREGVRLSDALSAAGGPVPNRSRTSQIRIQREVRGRPGVYEVVYADFAKFVHKNDFTQNIELLAGDIVFVPQTNTPDFASINQIANILFTLTALSNRNFNIFPRF